MAIFNIKSKIGSNLTKANWETGNRRENLVIKPTPLPYRDYTDCVFGFSETGLIGLSSSFCIMKTEALHGSQPNKDIFFTL